MDLNKNKKEMVLSRLKQTAAKTWGYQEADTEGFDPVINLLFGACASEFERLSTEVYRSQTRILEKVAQILLPEVYLCPNPSYAILQGKPLSLEKYTDESDQFIIEKEYTGNANGKPEKKKLYFSPVPGFRLIDAEITLMVTNEGIVKINDLLDKEIIIRTDTKVVHPENKVWLGLNINNAIKSINGISFYFDWFNNPEKEYLLNLLGASRWKINGKTIQIKNGFSQILERKYETEISDISSFLDINIKNEKKIIQFLEDHFMTIAENILPKKEKYPMAFNDLFENEELDNLKDDLCWIEIEFPKTFPTEYLESTFCTPTAFPVINRKLHDSNRPYSLNKDLNIIPVVTEDYFYSIRNIISENQTLYQEAPFKRISDFATGTFTVRTDAVKRFDERNAYEFIQYLIELLREEHVAFRSIGTSLIDKELDDLQIIINRLSLNVSKSKELKNNTHFAILKSEKEEDVWMEYWSTAGTFANNIPMGTSCLNNDFDKKGLKLLTSSFGGKNPPDQTEKVSLFKNELLTRNRVVTNEDIKVACFAELGNELKEVKISHSSILSNNRNVGFLNCIHVKLNFKERKSLVEKENLVRHVKKTLQQKSSCIYQYHVEAVN